MKTVRSPRLMPLPLACALALATPLLLLPTTPAQAQSAQQATHRFDIPAGPLAGALNQLATRAGISLSFDPALVGNRHSNGLQGSYSVPQALTRLLDGSGLTWNEKQGGAISIEALATTGDGVIATGTLSVAGDAAVDSAGPGSDPYATYTNPRSVAYVDRTRLDRMPQTTPSDLFDGITGVQMGNASSQGSFDPNIRGLQGHGRVKVLLDGSDTTQASRVTYAGNRSHNYVDPDFVAGIAVEKGPGLESGGLGGTISMRTFKADDIITDPDRNWGIRVRGMLGNNSGGENSTLACSRTRTIPSTGTSTSYVLSPSPTLLQRCQDNYTGTNLPWETSLPTYIDSYAFTRHDSGADVPSGNYSGSVIAAWRPVEAVDLLVDYARRQSGNYSAGEHGTIAADYPTNGGYFFDFRPKVGFSYYQPGEEVFGTYTDNESWLAKAGVDFGNQRLAFTWNRFESDYAWLSGLNTQASSNVLNYYPPASNTVQSRYGLDHGWRPGNDLVDLKLGVWFADTDELYYDTPSTTLVTNEIATDSRGANLSNTSLVELFSRTLTLKLGGQYKKEKVDSNTEVDGLEVEQYGLFASASLPLTDWLTADGGVRHDDYQARIDPGESYRFASDNRDSGNSLHAGLVWQPWEPLQVYARYAEGWRAPSMRENTLSNCAQGWIPIEFRGNTYYTCAGQGLIKPERSRNVEFGANLALSDLLADGDRLGLKLARFDNTIRDYIYGSGTTVLPFWNLDRARFVGYEASASYDAGWVFADYGFTYYDRVEYCGTVIGDPAQCGTTDAWGDLTSRYVPAKRRHDLTAGLRLLDRKLTLGGTATVVRATGYDYAGIDRYKVFDLFASYARGDFDFALSAQNLTDRYYFEAGTGASWSLPAPGRTIRATVTFKY